MASGNVTTTSAAEFIPELWSDPILDYAESVLRLRYMVRDVSELVRAQYSDGISKGDIIHIPRVSEESASDKAADTAVTYTNTTDPTTTLTINQHPYVAKRIENIARVQANVDLLDIYVKAMGYGLAKHLEAYLSQTILQSATSHDVTLGTDNQLTAAKVREAMQNLMDEGYNLDIWKAANELFWFSSPAIWLYMLGLGDFTTFTNTGIGPSGTVTGNMPGIYGVPAYTSTYWGSAGTTGEEGATLFAKEGVFLAMQQEPQMAYRPRKDDPDHLSDSVTVYMLYGAVLAYAASDSTLPVVNVNNP